MDEIKIGSEEAAFVLLERALNHELSDHPVNLNFDSWPIFEIKVEGPGYDSTITPDLAAALIEIQHAINRAYARSIHHSSNARTLTASERQSIQFKAKVERGSTVISVDLGDAVEKIGIAMAGKMGPEHIVITVVGLAIAAGSYLAYKAFLKSRTEGKALALGVQERIAMTQEETRRMEIFGRALKAAPEVAHAQQDFDIARTEVVRAARDATSISVNSLMLDGETARVVGISRRSESREIQLNGNYLIAATDLRNDDAIKLRVRRLLDGKEFVASFLDHSLEHDQIKMLKDAEWGRHAVFLGINATELRGEITTATVISVAVQPVVRPAAA